MTQVANRLADKMDSAKTSGSAEAATLRASWRRARGGGRVHVGAKKIQRAARRVYGGPRRCVADCAEVSGAAPGATEELDREKS